MNAQYHLYTARCKYTLSPKEEKTIYIAALNVNDALKAALCYCKNNNYTFQVLSDEDQLLWMIDEDGQ